MTLFDLDPPEPPKVEADLSGIELTCRANGCVAPLEAHLVSRATIENAAGSATRGRPT